MNNLIIIFLVLSINNAIAQTKRTDYTAGFLTHGVSPRTEALGGVYFPSLDDVCNIRYNPAGVGRLKHREINLLYKRYLNFLTYNFIACGTNIGTIAGVAASVDYLSIDTPRAANMALSAACAYRFNDVLLGLTAKAIRMNLADYVNHTVALDIGGLYISSLLDIGLGISNLGGRIKFAEKKYRLPIIGRAGTTLKFFNEDLKLTTGMDYITPDDLKVGVGAEYTYKIEEKKEISTRVGYLYRKDAIDKGPRIGIGAKYKNFIIDCAYLFSRQPTLLLSVDYRFIEPLFVKKVYKCDICKRAFSDKLSLTEHEKVHKPPEPTEHPDLEIFDFEVFTTSRTAVLVWYTNLPAESKAYYGTIPQYENIEQVEGTFLKHRIVLTGLSPDTVYYFYILSTTKDIIKGIKGQFKTEKE